MPETKHNKTLKPLDLPSCPPLFEPDVKLIVQQLLIICPHVNGYGQTLHRKVKKVLTEMVKEEDSANINQD